MKEAVWELRKFVAPEIVFGTGARRLAGRYCQNFHATRVLIVTDPGLLNTRWVPDVQASLEEAGIPWEIFSDISPNPRSSQVKGGVTRFTAGQCDCIIAVGGGSPMDCAKGIGIIATNGGSILDYEGVDTIPNPLPPLIFIPTTAGTASDVSQFSIINDEFRRVKIAIVSKIIVPDVALVDPETTLSMPSYLTACTGMDALVHAVEAYVSSAASPLTDIHALEAIRLLADNLPRIYRDPDNPYLRRDIMLASLEAGLAFSNAILGAVHAMAHSLGGLMDLPHGECNSLLLEHVIRYNFPAAPERYLTIAGKMGLNLRELSGKEQVDLFCSHIRNMRTDLGIIGTLSDRGVNPGDIPSLAEKAMKDACLLTNPRKLTLKEIARIYEDAL